MSRAKGTANLAASLEVLAGAPLDAREKVPTKADLYIAANFPYPYVGLETYVVAENKKYRLIGNDVTVEANWEEIGSGGSADTEIIADDFDPTESYAVGEYVVYEGTLYKCTTAHTGDWDASNFDGTQVMAEMPTPMPAADMSEIVTPLPSVMSRRHKYSTDEQVVGEWIDGKPLYQKTVANISLNVSAAWTNLIDVTDLSIDAFSISKLGFHLNSNTDLIMGIDAINRYYALAYKPSSGFIQAYRNAAQSTPVTIDYITIQYTKTTD